MDSSSATEALKLNDHVPRIRILVVRHGETDENVARVIQGRMDTDLNERGRDQARRTAEALKNERIDEIYSSPLKRAKDTAEAIRSQQKGSPSFILDDRLKERGFGSLEGKVFSGVKTDSIEGIESMTALTERLASFWNDLISGKAAWNHVEGIQTHQANGGDGSEPGKSSNVDGDTRCVLLVAHGAAISGLLSEVLLAGGYLFLPSDVKPSRFWNCSITEIFSPTISTPVHFQPSLSAGNSSRKTRWVVRPPHLNPRSNVTKSKQSGSDEWSDLDDIGYGPGLSVVKSWADVRHLPEILGGEGASSKAVKNVDEMVGKEVKEK